MIAAVFQWASGGELTVPLGDTDDARLVADTLSRAISDGDRAVRLTVPGDRTVFVMLEGLLHAGIGPWDGGIPWDSLPPSGGGDE